MKIEINYNGVDDDTFDSLNYNVNTIIKVSKESTCYEYVCAFIEAMKIIGFSEGMVIKNFEKKINLIKGE